jgi:hypothetical protein
MNELQKLHEQLQALEDAEMDYLEMMKLKFHIQDLIAEEEMKEFLKEMSDD